MRPWALCCRCCLVGPRGVLPCMGRAAVMLRWPAKCIVRQARCFIGSPVPLCCTDAASKQSLRLWGGLRPAYGCCA